MQNKTYATRSGGWLVTCPFTPIVYWYLLVLDGGSMEIMFDPAVASASIMF